MICNQCGAEFDDRLLHCPYCHSENRREAGRQKNLVLDSYDREAEHIRREADKYPEKAAKKWTNLLLTGILAALAAGVVFVIVFLLCSRLFTKLEYAEEDTILTKLEEYYVAEDYKTLSEYMQEEGLYSNTYEKYGEVRNIWNLLTDMEQSRESMEQVNTYTGFTREEKWESFKLWAEDYLSYARRAINTADAYINDRVFRQNEEVLKGLRQDTIDRLLAIGFSQEEIERIDGEEMENLTDLEEKLFEILISK